jgi:hypothetical protein
MTTTHSVKIDPDKRASDNIDKMVWAQLEDFIGPTSLRDFTNHRCLWVYYQYSIWYDAIANATPVTQLSRSEDYA